MEKKPNLSNVDELCVKYVFDELDPSEITLVEQAMMHDQNLLIEVESLKSTWNKLKKLPEMNPPPNISTAVIDHAKDYSNQQRFFGNHWRNPGLMATTAIVLFSLLISTAYLLPSETGTGNKPADARVAGTAVNADPVYSEKTESQQDIFRLWTGPRNMVYIGTNDESAENPIPDTLQQQGTWQSESDTNPFLISPALRDFQLTGTRY